MNAKHTPGPWEIDLEENRILATDDRRTIVCYFAGSLLNPSVMADARLIAAAPDLLESLEMLYAATPDNQGGDLGIACMQARKSLAKAKR